MKWWIVRMAVISAVLLYAAYGCVDGQLFIAAQEQCPTATPQETNAELRACSTLCDANFALDVVCSVGTCACADGNVAVLDPNGTIETGVLR
jgi:hypothetical protein